MKFNVPVKQVSNVKQITRNTPISPPKDYNKSNSNRTKVFDILKSVGFQHKDTEDVTILKLPSSDALYIKLNNSSVKVLLWCMEETYTHRDIKYSDCMINDTMNIGQIILYFLNNKQ